MEKMERMEYAELERRRAEAAEKEADVPPAKAGPFDLSNENALLHEAIRKLERDGRAQGAELGHALRVNKHLRHTIGVLEQTIIAQAKTIGMLMERMEAQKE